MINEGSLGKTVAHELGHAACIKHHGGTPNFSFDGDNQTIYPSSAGAQKKGALVSSNTTIGGYTLPHEFWVGKKGNNESGDEDCIIIYPNPYGAVYPSGNDYEAVPKNAHNRSIYFCSTKKGSSYNANGKCAGDATSGNCHGQIRVNDIGDK
jgi:hypothetical protein